MNNVSLCLPVVSIGTGHWPPHDENSFKVPAGSAETPAQAFSDPDPTTKVVSGSEKDAGGKRLAYCMGPSAAASVGLVNKGGREEEERVAGKRSVSAALNRESVILDFCHDHGFVTRRLIHRYLCADLQLRSIDRILERLEAKKLGKRLQGNWATRRGIFIASKKGHAVAAGRASYPLASRTRPVPETFDHDEAVIETRILLQATIGGRWQHESSLRENQFSEVPDGILHTHGQSKIAVEVEFTTKRKSRIERLIRRWSDSTVDLLIYVCRDDKMNAFVRERMQSVGLRVDHFATISLPDLRAGRFEVWTPAGFRRLPQKDQLP